MDHSAACAAALCKTAAHGHFGRDDIEFPWQPTDKAEVLKKAAGS